MTSRTDRFQVRDPKTPVRIGGDDEEEGWTFVERMLEANRAERLSVNKKTLE